MAPFSRGTAVPHRGTRPPVAAEPQIRQGRMAARATGDVNASITGKGQKSVAFLPAHRDDGTSRNAGINATSRPARIRFRRMAGIRE